ncbi:MAG: DUF3099 domain-containing protein [Nocardioidaceae bacterium]|nr:DUF3099 domain-containing protein [Nocardioidaceae bacterium]
MNQPSDDPVSITSARVSHSQDLKRRQRRYLLSMLTRTICFVLAIVTDGPVRWVLVAGAVFLPYIAVILANAGDTRTVTGPPAYHTEDLPALEVGPDAPPSGQTRG